ncbi:MAG: NADH-quinone oxidoreductase subunit A [Candidatus Gastranaerophilales bacterium]|nr:NADH-quinone oxidoreductase subunit A [Candidatus Gastranaerophilales bacterium]
MYSILITGFYILIAFLIAGTAVLIVQKSKTVDVSETEEDKPFQVSRMPIPQAYFVHLFVFFIFLIQAVLFFPLAAAFNKLRSFVFLEGGILVIFLVLALWYAIQKNMLRIKE